MAVSSDANTYKVPMLDARRKYVFGAIYDKDNKVVLKPSYLTLDDMNKELEKLDDYVVITNDKITGYEKQENYDPDLVRVVNTFQDKKDINPHAINPDYLKLTEAEESKQ